MALTLLERSLAIRGVVATSHFHSWPRRFCSRAPIIVDAENESTRLESVDYSGEASSTNYSNGIHLSPMFGHGNTRFNGFDIEIVDHDTWQISSSLAQAWRVLDNSFTEADKGIHDCSSIVKGDPDVDDIDNMRIHGDLFYKIDRGSKEFEEHNYDFHRKKSQKMKNDHKKYKKNAVSLNNSNDHREGKRHNLVSRSETFSRFVKNDGVGSLLDTNESCGGGKKKARIPTFNQLTGPYHEPFCLDIYISKASVRACIVHRVTSKVVAVAHSISKDMKFDLGSTRNYTACVSVGRILAQRALADDIHDAIYTPRKDEKLEGKLQIVLQAIIDNGVNVKVKLKQRKAKKAGQVSTY
ncbi:uncharacterized protein LOC110816459 [Carica papaya]|uniref:uncharacterized protein LOC110816459 n=1 Tax=Carica papaya TaxID=3649 RepID=UPI000B8CA5B1|nr:uncharacterized protein LOC110816459 [Carica papaya]